MAFTEQILYQYWPIGDKMPVRCAPEEVLYYRPATPVSDDEDDEVVSLPRRFDTVVAGTKRARSASFAEQRAAARKRVRDQEDAERVRAPVDVEQNLEDIPLDPAGSDGDMEENSLNGEGVKEDGALLNLPASSNTQDNVHQVPATNVQISIGSKLARGLSSFGRRSLIITCCTVTRIKNALGYDDDDDDNYKPRCTDLQSASSKLHTTLNLPGSYISTPPTSPAQQDNALYTLEDGTEYDHPQTASPQSITEPAVPEHRTPIELPASPTEIVTKTNNRKKVRFAELRPNKSNPFQALRRCGTTTTSRGEKRKHVSHTGDAETWEQNPGGRSAEMDETMLSADEMRTRELNPDLLNMKRRCVVRPSLKRERKRTRHWQFTPRVYSGISAISDPTIKRKKLDAVKAKIGGTRRAIEGTASTLLEHALATRKRRASLEAVCEDDIRGKRVRGAYPREEDVCMVEGETWSMGEEDVPVYVGASPAAAAFPTRRSVVEISTCTGRDTYDSHSEEDTTGSAHVAAQDHILDHPVHEHEHRETTHSPPFQRSNAPSPTLPTEEIQPTLLIPPARTVSASTYPSKAGAALECSYRPGSPGLEPSTATQRRLELGSTSLSEEKIRSLRVWFGA